MFCPYCGREMRLADGVFACIAGDMTLSTRIHALLRERFPTDKPRAESAEIGHRASRWFCPECGVPLDNDACCRYCGQTLRDLLSALSEHLHGDEAAALKYEADLQTAQERLNRVRDGILSECYTDRAETVIQLAVQEAQRFNAEFLGTEHLLLGLLKENGGVAAHVLKGLGLNLQQVRATISTFAESGSDVAHLRMLPLTPRMTRAVEHSLGEARRLNHNYVGTEHLLLGLLCDPENTAVQSMVRLGVPPDDVRSEILNLLGHELE